MNSKSYRADTNARPGRLVFNKGYQCVGVAAAKSHDIGGREIRDDGDDVPTPAVIVPHTMSL